METERGIGNEDEATGFKVRAVNIDELCIMWCQLNCWETPERLKSVVSRDLTENEVYGAMAVIEMLTTYEEIIEMWGHGRAKWKLK